jgi:DNA-binding LacI/PurR family transcriptional regulator
MSEKKITYTELASFLARGIRERTWEPGTRLPSTRSLARRHDVGVKVARMALVRLEEMGLVELYPRSRARVRSGVCFQADAPIAIVSGSPAGQLLDNAAYGGVIYGIIRALDAVSPPLSMFCHEDHRTDLPAILEKTPQSALVLVGLTQSNPNLLPTYEQLDLPVVVADEPVPEKIKLSNVAVDNAWAASMIAKRLSALGHRRMACVGRLRLFARSKDPDNEERGESFVSSCLRLGLRPPNIQTSWVTFNPSDVRRALTRFLNDEPRPTAIVCTDGGLALELMKLAEEKGLNVPRDLSVASFHEKPEHPQTVNRGGAQIDFRELGKVTGEELVVMIRTFAKTHRKKIVRRRMRPQITDGDTIGPPPNRSSTST